MTGIVCRQHTVFPHTEDGYLTTIECIFVQFTDSVCKYGIYDLEMLGKTLFSNYKSLSNYKAIKVFSDQKVNVDWFTNARKKAGLQGQ